MNQLFQSFPSFLHTCNNNRNECKYPCIIVWVMIWNLQFRTLECQRGGKVSNSKFTETFIHKLGNHQVKKFLLKATKWNSRWCVFQRQAHNFPFKRLSLTLPTTPTKSYLQGNIARANPSQNIVCYAQALGYHELFENQPKKFCDRKVVHTELPEQRLHY